MGVWGKRVAILSGLGGLIEKVTFEPSFEGGSLPFASYLD